MRTFLQLYTYFVRDVLKQSPTAVVDFSQPRQLAKAVEIVDHMNNAEEEYCKYTKCLFEDEDTDITEYTLATGVDTYLLHSSLFQITNVALHDANGVFVRYLSKMIGNPIRKHLTGMPQGYRLVRQTSDGFYLRVNPTPIADYNNYTLVVNGYRTPKEKYRVPQGVDKEAAKAVVCELPYDDQLLAAEYILWKVKGTGQDIDTSQRQDAIDARDRWHLGLQRAAAKNNSVNSDANGTFLCQTIIP